MRLLLTRPESDAARSAAILRERGHEVVVAPLIWIEPVAADFGQGPWTAVLITSANALLGLGVRGPELAGLPLIAVGDRSAAAARAAGFTDVTSAAGALADLVALVRQRGFSPDQRLLYLAGADQAGDLAADLGAAGPTVETRVVYRAAVIAKLSEPVRTDLMCGRIDGVLHYSRRAAEAYLLASEAFRPAALVPVHFCLSDRIAEPLAAAGARQIRIAAAPTGRSLLDLVDST